DRTPQVRLCLSFVCETAGGLDDDLGADLLPRNLCRILLCKDAKFVVGYLDRRLTMRHLVVEVSEDRGILPQVSERSRVGQIVYCNKIELFVFQGRSQHVAAYTPEPINPNFDRHCTPSQNREE